MKKNILFMGLIVELLFAGLLGIYLVKTPSSQELIRNIRKKFILKKYTPNTTAYLKKSISIDYPDIDRSGVTDLEKTNILRQWASDNIAWAASGPAQINKLIQGKEAPYIFGLFEQNKGGVDCGGAGYSLMKLYKLYGFESYEYHYGNLEDWNHAITLVKISHRGKNILVMEDAFFNTTYTYSNGEPLDFFDFLQILRIGDMDKIKLVKDGDGRHLNIYIEKNRVIKQYSATYFFALENNLHSYLNPRFLQRANDEEGTDVMMKKIQSLVVY